MDVIIFTQKLVPGSVVDLGYTEYLYVINIEDVT